MYMYIFYSSYSEHTVPVTIIRFTVHAATTLKGAAYKYIYHM